MNDERGFTLIETLVATLLFATIVTTMSALGLTAFASSDWNKDRGHAVAIAESQFEGVRAVPYPTLANGNSLSTATRDGQRFRVVRTVALGRPGPGMAIVTVGVSWSGRGGRDPSYVAQTIVTSVQR